MKVQVIANFLLQSVIFFFFFFFLILAFITRTNGGTIFTFNEGEVTTVLVREIRRLIGIMPTQAIEVLTRAAQDVDSYGRATKMWSKFKIYGSTPYGNILT